MKPTITIDNIYSPTCKNIVHLWFKEGTTIDALFSNGVIKRYDVLNFVETFPGLLALKDRSFFLKGINMRGGIYWDENVDVGADEIYDYGTDVSFEYNDYERLIVEYEDRNKSWLLKKAIYVWFKENVAVDVLFDDGLVKRFNMLKIANNSPVIEKLKDYQLFKKGKLTPVALTWTTDIDIETRVIYALGDDVTNEYDNVWNLVVGFKIKQKRIKKRISQEQLAELSGIDQATLSKIEKGQMNISIKTIARITNALNAKIKFDIK